MQSIFKALASQGRKGVADREIGCGHRHQPGGRMRPEDQTGERQQRRRGVRVPQRRRSVLGFQALDPYPGAGLGGASVHKNHQPGLGENLGQFRRQSVDREALTPEIAHC